MALNSADLTRMSRLLDEALPLDGLGRKAWLETLPAEHQDLLSALRTALLTPAGEARHHESLTDLPDLGPSIDAVLAAQGSDINAGSVVGPYRLIRELGRGGMGSVWLAERTDGTLKRQVAFKLPHSTLPQRQFAERFSRECDILAGLVHANIARLYDAGVTVEGKPWLALEYVEGEAISTWCDARKLTIKARIELFQQVLAAVHYAHRQQVIHRDLKPNNILVNRDGDVRLLDFGIAKMMAEGEVHETALTQIGGRALSIQYASPEQILGQPVSATSDVYSLGVVLFELLTGSFPYFMQRGSRGAIEDNILSVVPARASLTSANSELAANRGTIPTKLSQALKGDLDAVLQKALKKNPAERYESAKALTDELDRYLHGKPVLARSESTWVRVVNVVRRHKMASAAISALMALSIVGVVLLQLGDTSAAISALVAVSVVGVVFLKLRNQGTESALIPTLPPSAPVSAGANVSDKSIAVLPFVDMSEKHDQEYFSDGLTEELINHLTQYADLKVIARTSSFYFKGKNEDMRTIASKLGVANLLEGSVRKSGKALRITAKLIRASDGAHLWSQTYDRQLDDIFKVQNEIAGEVVKALKVSLLEGSLPNATGPKNTEAYTLYLQARSIYDHSGGAGANEDYAKVVDYLHQAIKLDAGFAPAWAYLSNVLSQQAAFGFVPSQKGYEDARRAAKEALRLDPMLPEAYTSMAKIQYLYDWDWAGAQSNVQQALQLNPQNSAALASAAMFGTMGEPERSVELNKKAVASDTLSALRYSWLGMAEYNAGMLDDAQRHLLKALDLNPGAPNARYILGWVQIAKGKPTEALAEFERSSEEVDHLVGRALAYYAMGRKADADLALAEIEKKVAAEYAYVIAQIHAYRKEFDRAFSWLDRAYRQHEYTCGFVKSEPMFKALRSDPRYKAFLRKMKLPE